MTFMENIRDIITNLYCYNCTLFVSYLNGTIKAFGLPKNWFSFPNLKPIMFAADPGSNFAISMTALNRYLYVTTPKHLIVYDLRDNNQIYGDVFKEIGGCSNVKIDYVNKLLFVVSDSRGLVVFDISREGYPRYLKDINLKEVLHVDNYNLTDIEVADGYIFLSLRGFGIARFDYHRDHNEFSQPNIIRMVQKIELSDPQEVRYSFKNKMLFIVDNERGLVLLNTLNNEVFRERQLPNADRPKRVFTYNENCIVQGSRGLYYYRSYRDDLNTILGHKVGAVTKYYNHFIMSKKNEIQLVNMGETKAGFDRLKYPYFSKVLH